MTKNQQDLLDRVEDLGTTIRVLRQQCDTYTKESTRYRRERDSARVSWRVYRKGYYAYKKDAETHLKTIAALKTTIGALSSLHGIS
jgi:hypothetical protein